MWKAKISHTLWWFQNTGKHWNKQAMAMVKTPLLASTNNLWYLLMLLPKEIWHFLQLFTGINSMAYFLSFHSLSDELKQVTFLSLIIGLSQFPFCNEEICFVNHYIRKKTPCAKLRSVLYQPATWPDYVITSSPENKRKRAVSCWNKTISSDS